MSETFAENDVVILAAARTPVGSFKGALASLSAPQLGAVALKRAIAQSGVAAEEVEEAVLGHAVQAGTGQSPARQAALLAGLPEHCDAATVNKVCASGMKAISIAAQSIRLGLHGVVVAGGMESMSNAPFLLPRTNPAFGHLAARDALAADGLDDAYEHVAMGVFAERTASKHGVSRAAQDAHAVESYRRAERAWARGAFAAEIAPVAVRDAKGRKTLVVEDEEYKRIIYEKVPTLRPVFLTDGSGTVTAANSSPLNDGASALVLASLSRAQELGATPLARIIAYAEAAVAPADFIEAPTLAVPIALARAGLTPANIALWEFNEAFSVAIRTIERVLGLDPEKINVNGGAVALGHALGNSGARIVVTLVHALRAGQYGVAAVCNGGGGGSAIVIQKL